MKKLIVFTEEHMFIIILCLANIFLSFHYFLTIYINSSFVNNLIPTNKDLVVTTLYSLAALITCLCFLHATYFLSKVGAYRFALSLTTIDLVAVYILSTTDNPYVVLPFLLLHIALVPLILYILDIFLEHFSPQAVTTGAVRGLFLTVSNVALVLSPLCISLLGISQNDFSYIYKLSGFFLVPFLFILLCSFRNFKDPVYPNPSVHGELYKLMRNKNIRGAVLANLLLQFFFSIMVIYFPIYIISTVGLSVKEFALMLSIALLPFALFELPIGLLADKKYGEKEMMGIGFVIIAIFGSLLSFITSPNFWIFTTFLLLTRVGAALVEATSESYFFKMITDEDADLTSLFRMTRPFAYLVSPLLALPFIALFSYHYLFAIVGVLMLLGLFITAGIEDTR